MALGLVAAVAIAELGAWLYYLRFVSTRAVVLAPFHLESEGEVPLEVEDPELFWRYRSNLRGRHLASLAGRRDLPLETNAYGLRDDPVERPKPADLFRIVCVGESTTHGDWVTHEQTYSERLQATLNARDDGWRYDVVNAGHGGYSSFQGRRLLELHGAEWEPDLVLTYHENNDTLPTGHRHSENARLGLGYTDVELHAKLQGARTGRWPRVREWLLRHSWSFWLVHLGALDRDRVPPADQRANYEAMLALTEAWSARLVVLHPIWDRREPHECGLTRFAAEHDLLLVELLDAWQASGLSAGDLFVDGVHPTPRGHALIAGAIARDLDRGGLLPPPRDRPRAPRE